MQREGYDGDIACPIHRVVVAVLLLPPLLLVVHTKRTNTHDGLSEIGIKFLVKIFVR